MCVYVGLSVVFGQGVFNDFVNLGFWIICYEYDFVGKEDCFVDIMCDYEGCLVGGFVDCDQFILEIVLCQGVQC